MNMVHFPIKIEQIEAVLPQTQCGQCGYPGCRSYATAIVVGEAAINQCPPGGTATLEQLAELMRVDPAPLLATLQARIQRPRVALIHEEACIGCTKCLQACPVDAIFGAAKVMHTVISAECTGCALCVEPCPMDCIELQEVKALSYSPHKARQRYQAKLQRGDLKRAGLSAAMLEAEQDITVQENPVTHASSTNTPDKKSLIAQAVARARAKKSALNTHE